MVAWTRRRARPEPRREPEQTQNQRARLHTYCPIFRRNAPLHTTPISPQSHRGADAQGQQEHDRHVPKVAGLARGDAGFGIRNLIRQLGRLHRACSTARRSARESFSSSSRFCEVWKFSATPSSRRKVSTSWPISSGIAAGDDLGHVRARLLRRPFAAVDAFFERQRAASSIVALVPSGLRKRACTLAFVTGLYSLSRTSTRIGTRVSSASTGRRRGGGHLARRIGHQVAEHLLPEGGMRLVGVIAATSASASCRRWRTPPCGRGR